MIRTILLRGGGGGVPSFIYVYEHLPNYGETYILRLRRTTHHIEINRILMYISFIVLGLRGETFHIYA